MATSPYTISKSCESFLLRIAGESRKAESNPFDRWRFLSFLYLTSDCAELADWSCSEFDTFQISTRWPDWRRSDFARHRMPSEEHLAVQFYLHKIIKKQLRSAQRKRENVSQKSSDSSYPNFPIRVGFRFRSGRDEVSWQPRKYLTLGRQW